MIEDEMGMKPCEADIHATAPWEREEDADGKPIFVNRCATCDALAAPPPRFTAVSEHPGIAPETAQDVEVRPGTWQKGHQMSVNGGGFGLEESGVKIVQFAAATDPYRAWYLCPGDDRERPHLFSTQVIGWAVIEYPGLSAIVPMVMHQGEHELEPANTSDNFLCAEHASKTITTIQDDYRDEIALLKDRLASEDTPLVYRPHFSNN